MHLADLVGLVKSMLSEDIQDIANRVGGTGNEKTAARLWVREQRAFFEGKAGGQIHVIPVGTPVSA